MNPVSAFVNRILTGDSTVILPQLPAASIDFVLTDPPYLVNYRDRRNRTVPNDDNTAWLRPAFAQISRVLKNDRFCISFYGWNKADLFLKVWKSVGLYPVGHFVWVKQYASSAGFVGYRHESAYLLAKGRPEKPHIILPDVLRWTYTGNKFHPTQKSVRVLMPLIKAYSKPGDLILDPFAGSGTTAVTARLMKRQYIGIEMNAEYADIATRRLRAIDRLP